ncbi:hypothetical protein KFL_013310010 [Klebsormidium nitens]|uniref:DNA primase/polymerase bifunctional N-terminal domain-containing protein n=1 Tax=Klebsormidium nitens TaxID=105231 RepID=A0A1Y1IQN1_KLENI|nr:hypothetical protein KFL_013310010 [Klebsormidium nitens]|eukprot:GAQ93160.1 hypothetical protein KFL_013310010 [Klebsormidium nitens]
MTTSLNRSSDSDSESLEATVDRNIESEPNSASEAKDGESLEGMEFEDRLIRPNCLKARRTSASKEGRGPATMRRAATSQSLYRKKQGGKNREGPDGKLLVVIMQSERLIRPPSSSSPFDEDVEAEERAIESRSEVGDQSATSSEWGDRPDDNDTTWDSDDEGDFEELREFFGVCRIDLGFERDCTELEQEFAKPGRNSIAIVTEQSDIYALDVDVKDGGFEALERMVTENDVFLDDTPHVITGNGGLHLLFSLSKSEEAGLLNSSNRARILYSGEAVGIVVRGRGGMLYTAPSSYKGVDGIRRSYEWKEEILPDRSNLRAVPDWLIRILNGSGEAPSERGRMARGGDGARKPQTVPIGPPRPIEDPRLTPPAAVLERVKACVAATGDTASWFDRLKMGDSGPMYVFRVAAPRRCPYGNHHDGSNNFSVLVRKRDLLYCCNSSECQGVRPLLKIGELTRSEAMSGGETRAFGADDVSAINSLHKRFVDAWAFEGDVGGSKIVGEMYAGSGRLCFDGECWHYWDGRRFVADEKSAFFVKNVLINQLRIVYKQVRDELSAAIETTRDEEQREVLQQQLKHLRTYNNSREMGSTLDLARGELFVPNFIQQLDANPDVLNTKNGVLLLRTGMLDAHRPEYMCSKIAETDFMEIEYPTPLVDAFLSDIFNHDSELVDYIRKLYGYALNGHTREEIFVLLLGGGGEHLID